jgi:hypothetical protein
MIQKFRKKPVVIEAVQWNTKNYDEIVAFTDGKARYYEWFQYNESGLNKEMLHISTLEGKMEASKGDWIIKGVKGEFYPCKPDIFEQTYEKVD